MKTKNTKKQDDEEEKESTDKKHRPASKTMELPKATVERIAKNVLPDNTQISNEAKLAITKAAQVFILYITATANEIKEEKGKGIIAPEHVIRALEDTEFAMFIESAKNLLEEKKTSDAVKNLNPSTTPDGTEKNPPKKKKKKSQESQKTPTDPHKPKKSSKKSQKPDSPIPLTSSAKPSPTSRQNSSETLSQKPPNKEHSPSQGSVKVITLKDPAAAATARSLKSKALDDIPTIKSNKLKKEQLDDSDDPMENEQDDKPTPHREDSPDVDLNANLN